MKIILLTIYKQTKISQIINEQILLFSLKKKKWVHYFLQIFFSTDQVFISRVFFLKDRIYTESTVTVWQLRGNNRPDWSDPQPHICEESFWGRGGGGAGGSLTLHVTLLLMGTLVLIIIKQIIRKKKNKKKKTERYISKEPYITLSLELNGENKIKSEAVWPELPCSGETNSPR